MTEVVIGAAVLVAVVLLVVRSWAHRSKPAATPAAKPGEPVPTQTGLPTFDVVALGTRGSGKTMLLASMYSQLQTSPAAATTSPRRSTRWSR